MRYFGAAFALMLGSAIQVAACASRVTSLDSEKTLASLTTEERRQYCEDQFHYKNTRVDKDDRKKIDCAAAASAVGHGGRSDAAKARAACQQVYRACMSVPAAEPQSSCEAFPAKADGCMATVGEASKCAEAQADELEKLAAKADTTCTDLDRMSESGQRREKPSTTQACARVEVLCPNLFGEHVPGVGAP